jgi:hypothetical protein
MVHRFLNVVLIFLIQIKFSQRYIANIIGAVCNSRIPLANLHAVLNFVHETNYSDSIISNLNFILVGSKSAKTHRNFFYIH